MTYWVNVYEGGQEGLPWESREEAVKSAIRNQRVSIYRIKVTLKGKA